MRYTEKKFSVAAGASQKYRDNWEATFRGEKKEEPVKVMRVCTVCGNKGANFVEVNLVPEVDGSSKFICNVCGSAKTVEEPK